MRPLKVVSNSFKFHNGAEAYCIGIVCPALPAEMITDEARAVAVILDAIKIAQKEGAKLVGLGGFTSIVADNGLEVSRNACIPVTSGNTYTAAVILQSIRSLTERMGVHLNEARVAVIGATGDIGSACARGLVGDCGELVLAGRNDKRLEHFRLELAKEGRAVVEVKRAREAAACADVVITVTSALTTLIESRDLKKGAIVCDASYPPNVAKEIRKQRKDIVVFEGGIVSWNELNSQVSDLSPIWSFNPRGGVHGCFAETLLLALEEKFTTFSIGRGNITLEKMKAILQLGEKYGFSPMYGWDGEFLEPYISKLEVARNSSTRTARVNI